MAVFFALASRRSQRQSLVWAAVACAMAACTTTPPPAPVVVAPPAPRPPVAVIMPPPAPAPTVVRPSYVSQASTPKDYRRDAATHLYSRLPARIYQGKMPPLLHAVGVLQVDIDSTGGVTDVRWMRPPTHVPAVMAEIERTVRAAAPYPAPVRMQRVTYTDTWLWHKTGRFQLDTLSEGQL